MLVNSNSEDSVLDLIILWGVLFNLTTVFKYPNQFKVVIVLGLYIGNL
ncbi:hypothetical protein SAMN03080602_04336 [Arenibacter troitsensis]|uniref:Uncharacterized protein n=1 Tax=Arenibacter troitsensis TaxID=188872 RepID=A0A1X7LIN1_9FLAO|nr:hypothetical protein SAMN03080602_04336 [Arenibacter troitsensis]